MIITLLQNSFVITNIVVPSSNKHAKPFIAPLRYQAISFPIVLQTYLVGSRATFESLSFYIVSAIIIIAKMELYLQVETFFSKLPLTQHTIVRVVLELESRKQSKSKGK